MAYSINNLPTRYRFGRATAVAFALAITATWQPAPVMGQIEVDVLTTPTETTSSATTAPATTAVQAPTQDNSADEAARKIVPAPGTAMQSTQNSTLSNAPAVAQEPSLKLQEDQMVLQEGETTESVAVRSGVELLRMLGIQRKPTGTADGLELDEGTTNSLFDVTAIQRLKGAEPTVVYRVIIEDVPLPDPMIVPWIRQAKLLQERFDKAVNLLAENRVDEGRQELLSVITDFPESDHAQQAKALLAKLDDLNRSEIPAPVMPQAEETTVTVRLSPNVRVGTVIVDPENPQGNRVMIGGRTYSVGEELYAEEGHRVLSISENVVQIEVEQSGVKEIFDVPVRPIGSNN